LTGIAAEQRAIRKQFLVAHTSMDVRVPENEFLKEIVGASRKEQIGSVKNKYRQLFWPVEVPLSQRFSHREDPDATRRRKRVPRSSWSAVTVIPDRLFISGGPTKLRLGLPRRILRRREANKYTKVLRTTAFIVTVVLAKRRAILS
jgi:hypothetical protein